MVSPEHCSAGGLGYDDVDLFGRLRSLTIVKGLELPPQVLTDKAITSHH